MERMRFWAGVVVVSTVFGFGGAACAVLVLGEQLRGTQGPQGIAGAAGSAGAPGERGPVGPAGPEPLPPASARSWDSAYTELTRRIGVVESRIGAVEATAGRPTSCTPMKVVTRIADRYDPLAAATAGPVGITAYSGYACAAK
jgi:hypothetical protein